MSNWILPRAITVGETQWNVCIDYRDILEILDYLNDDVRPIQNRLYLSLALFIDDFDNLPVALRSNAAIAMLEFINCGETAEENARPKPQEIDWHQDCAMITADINRVAGCEIRALPYLHWWTFIAYFSAIGQGQLSTVVGIRQKIRKNKKLDEWEREFYLDNKSKVDLKPHYSPEELAEVKRLKQILEEEE